MGVIENLQKINNKDLARFEVSLKGKTLSFEHLSSSDKGVFRHLLNGTEIDPPLCLVKYPIKEGESWDAKAKVGQQLTPITCTVGKWQQVEVPAGKFKAIQVTVSIEALGGGGVHQTQYWFAAGMGIVMQEVKVGFSRQTATLETFSPAIIEPNNLK